jgi:hypothetical protein
MICDALLLTLVFLPVAIVIASVRSIRIGRQEFIVTIKNYFAFSFFMGLFAVLCIGLPAFLVWFLVLLVGSKWLFEPGVATVGEMPLEVAIAAACFYIPWLISQILACYATAGGRVRGWTE